MRRKVLGWFRARVGRNSLVPKACAFHGYADSPVDELMGFPEMTRRFWGKIHFVLLYGAIESVTDPQDVRDPSGESVRVKVDKGISFVILELQNKLEIVRVRVYCEGYHFQVT